jgi:hypothetical protein
MDDQRFWAFVAAARDAAGDDAQERIAGLEQVLLAQDPDDVQEFQDKYDELLQRANTWALWGAASLMNGGCSDDGFRYFRDWLISEGEAVFEAALADPDSLAELPRDSDCQLEGFGYVAGEVFEQMTDTPIARRRALEGGEPTGASWREDQLAALYPRIARKYGG